MRNRHSFPFLVGAIALIVVVVAIGTGWRLLNGDNSLLREVSFGHPQISPNADGDNDATPIAYELSRNATVSIYFENQSNDRYYFRQEKSRGAGQYQVLFSGIVDGYRLPEESIQGEILSRLLQNGNYVWTVTATDDRGVTESEKGQ
jgi:hypothetical protein